MKNTILYKLFFFLSFGPAPYGRIVDKYEENGTFYFKCECFCPSDVGPMFKNGKWHTITVITEPRYFSEHSIGSRYLVNPSMIIV